MTPDRLDVARRLSACQGWQWLPGMVAIYERSVRPTAYIDGDPDSPTRGAVLRRDDGDRTVSFRITGDPGERVPIPMTSPCDYIPDLDDELTRHGVLAVVRRAWDDDTLTIGWCHHGWRWAAQNQVTGELCDGWAVSEESALLAALESQCITPDEPSCSTKGPEGET